jgi:hypothetical protein
MLAWLASCLLLDNSIMAVGVVPFAAAFGLEQVREAAEDGDPDAAGEHQQCL